MPGGAAAKAKKKQEEEKAAEDMRQEYSTWHSKADRTEDTGVMRLLVVSMVLEAEQQTAHAVPVTADQGPEDPITTSAQLKPSADGYDNVHSYMIEDENSFQYEPWRGPIGWDVQAEYEDALIAVRDSFLYIWEQLDLSKRHDSIPMCFAVREGHLNLKHNPEPDALISEQMFSLDEEICIEKCCWVRVESAVPGSSGAWYKGPRKLFVEAGPDKDGEMMTPDCDQLDLDGKPIWDYERMMRVQFFAVYGPNDVEDHIDCGTEDLVKAEKAPPLIPPWQIEGKYAELERWIYEGIGTTTYWSCREEARSQGGKETMVPVYEEWSMEDLTGTLGLTDRERISLRQAYQLFMQEEYGGPGVKLNQAQLELKKKVYNIVEFGPYHKPQNNILQWRVRSLKKQMQNKCVFWSNTEDTLPGGSVADNTYTPFDPNAPPDPPIVWSEAREKPPTACGKHPDDEGGDDGEPAGWDNQVFEFWKYGKKIGTIRKKYVVEDRQRLLDSIEMYTPTYKGVMKNIGEYEPSDDVDHRALPRTMQIIANVSALALDLTLPEMPEDRVACYIKTRLEQVMGPTWHVVVGRMFGFCITVEARHFVQMRMRHLEIVVWKSEPDASAGKSREVEG